MARPLLVSLHQINVAAGDLDIVYGAGAIVPGTVYTLIENTGGTTTGQFNGLAEGSIISLAIPNPTTGPTQIPAQLLRISYQGGSGKEGKRNPIGTISGLRCDHP